MLAAGLAMVGALFATATEAASAEGTPMPSSIQTVFLQIRAQHSGKCLDVTGGTAATGDGVPIQQWTSLGAGQTNQTW